MFLHPVTHEEYALARQERKVAPGYRGFTTQFSPDVTLEEDLKRRDLTINAMAESADGALIDPYGGQADLAARAAAPRVGGVRRGSGAHPARRALRRALCAAWAFRLRRETLELMRRMAAGRRGRTRSCPSASGRKPSGRWAKRGRRCSSRRCAPAARSRCILPELDALFGVPQPPRWHPEMDTGVHVMLALRYAADLGVPNSVRFAVLTA